MVKNETFWVRISNTVCEYVTSMNWKYTNARLARGTPALSSSHNKAKFVKPNFQGREKPSRNYVNKNTTTISMMSVAPSQYWSQALSKCNAVVCYRNIMAPSLKNWTNEHCNVCRKKESAFYILPPSLLLEKRAASCSLLLEEPWDSEKIMPFISSSYDGSSRRSSGSSDFSGLRGLDRFSSSRKSSVYERPSTYTSRYVKWVEIHFDVTFLKVEKILNGSLD